MEDRPGTAISRKETEFGVTQARSYYFQIEKDEIEHSEIFFGYADNDDEINEGFLGPFVVDGFLDFAPSDKGTSQFRERV